MRHAFGDDVRQVLADARDEAIRRRQGYLGPRHVLIALLGPARASFDGQRLFRRLGVEPSRVREAVIATFPAGREEAEEEGSVAGGGSRPGGVAPPGRHRQIPYTSRVKRLLQLAVHEARGVGRRGRFGGAPGRVTTLHLALAAIREAEEAGRSTLAELGVRSEAARRVADEGIEGSARDDLDRPERSGETGRSGEVWFLEVDPEARPPIYEQIVSGIAEAVATGRLREGERVPSIRDLADELEVAPGTVARAYRELEARDVLLTDGARGTRVTPAGEEESPREADPVRTLEGLMRPVVVAGYHLGVGPRELLRALDAAMRGIEWEGREA